jgi:hypothetical protein
MELLEKGKSDEDKDKDKEEDKGQPEDETTPEEQPQEETTPEEQPQDETQPEEQPQEEPAPEPEPEPEPDVIISGEGIIEAGNPKTNTFTVTINGTSVTLNYDKNSKYATGYFPQQGDKVRIEYNKSQMLLNDIQLIERPVPAAEEAPAEEAAE